MTGLSLLRPRWNSPPSDVFRSMYYRTIGPIIGLSFMSSQQQCSIASFSAASIMPTYVLTIKKQWWTAISLKASGFGERGNNVCAFGVINDKTVATY